MSRCAVVVVRLSVVHALTVHGPGRKPFSGLRIGVVSCAFQWFTHPRSEPKRKETRTRASIRYQDVMLKNDV